ncbi:MAG: D-glucuronyl C5-epimerase family protein [Solirubrobacterales bacterium]
MQAALAVGDHLLELQEPEGRLVGGWVHRFPYKHTYHLPPPWLSGMAQGQGASLLVRLYSATGDERYAEAAIRALEPMRHSTLDGGVAGDLGGGFFPQEYPTNPPAHVLNGGIFALWGCYDAALALGDDLGRQLAAEGIATLAESLPRWDTGYWSRYDLFPHPLAHLATPMYHRLHTDQLRAMALIDTNPEFSRTAERFDGYARSRVNVGHAFARKVLFRLAVPRNRWLAFRTPWTRRSGR